MEEDVERLDKAFEWIFLFLTISFATFFQWITWIWQSKIMEEPKYRSAALFGIRFMFIPLIVIILIWFGKIITEEPKKMFLRKLAWSWSIFQLWCYILLTSVLVTLDMTNDIQTISTAISVFVMPLLTYVIYRKIINIYKKAMLENVFWRNRWWDYGTSLVSILTITLFLIFVFASQPLTP